MSCRFPLPHKQDHCQNMEHAEKNCFGYLGRKLLLIKVSVGRAPSPPACIPHKQPVVINLLLAYQKKKNKVSVIFYPALEILHCFEIVCMGLLYFLSSLPIQMKPA